MFGLIYEAQEGRGMAYRFQDAGADLRTYQVAVGVSRVRLLSNNPEKIKALEAAGAQVEERVPCQPETAPSTEAYLRAKKEKLGHMLEGL